jgi:hypothetical protein
MSDHQKFIDTAVRLIAKHGRDTSFEVISSTPANPDMPWRGTNTPPLVIGPLKAAFVPFRGFTFGSEYLDNQLFKECDEVCLVGGGQGELETAHMVMDGAVTFKVEWVQRLRPGDQTILYAIGVTR